MRGGFELLSFRLMEQFLAVGTAAWLRLSSIVSFALPLRTQILACLSLSNVDE